MIFLSKTVFNLQLATFTYAEHKRPLHIDLFTSGIFLSVLFYSLMSAQGLEQSLELNRYTLVKTWEDLSWRYVNSLFLSRPFCKFVPSLFVLRVKRSSNKWPVNPKVTSTKASPFLLVAQLCLWTNLFCLVPTLILHQRSSCPLLISLHWSAQLHCLTQFCDTLCCS